MKKSGFVAIAGDPNVGKSTLMNQFLDIHLSITSPKPQTTRDKIFGIYFKDNVQIVFQDLPGFLSPDNKLQEKMQEDISEGISDSDILLILVDSRERLNKYLNTLKKIKFENVIFCVNKTDLNKNFDNFYKNFALEKGWEFFEISALNGTNCEELLQTIIKKIPQTDYFYYDKDYLTNRSERFIVKEYIREAVLENFREEIPHEIFVEVTEMKEKEKIIEIDSVIYTARESQKGIVIGKKGSMLKKIGQTSREKLESFFSKKIFLKIRVKVKKKWYNDSVLLKKLKQDIGTWN
ncbi:MAG: GTPase Era [Candidatus Muiribacteriota bacterium]